jgi:PAS domain S-box-containing protein
MALSTLHGNISPFWPVCGFTIWLVLAGGTRMWPAIAAAELVVNQYSGISLGVSVVMAAGNVVESLAGAAVWHRLRSRFQSSRSEKFIPLCSVAASLAAPVAAAAVGMAALYFGERTSLLAAFHLATTWYVGDAIGSLFTLPVLLSLPRLVRLFARSSRRDALKCVAVLVATAAVSAAAFLAPGMAGFAFGIFPVLLLASLWTETPIVGVAALLAGVFATAATYYGHGPFVTGNMNQDLLNMQIFLVAVALMGQLLPMFRGQGSLFAGAILLAGWTLSGAIFESMLVASGESDAKAFTTLVSNATRDIEDRQESVLEALGSCRSLLLVSPSVSRSQWEQYVGALNLGLNYSGISALGVVFPVSDGDLEEFTEGMRADGAPAFAVHGRPGVAYAPSGERQVIAFVEPVLGNEGALGLDIAADGALRLAAGAARDTGEVQITVKVALAQDPERRPAYAVFLPVYRLGSRLSTVSERRTALIAWIYAPLITSNFMDGAIRRGSTELSLSVFDGTDPDPARLVYSSAGAGSPTGSFRETRVVKLARKSFLLGWNPGPDFKPSGVSGIAWSALGLALGTFFAASFVQNLQETRRRAEELANERTRALRDEMGLREQVDRVLRDVSSFQSAILDSANIAIISTTPDGLIRTFNAAAQRMLGYAEAELAGFMTPFVFLVPGEVRERSEEFSRELGEPVAIGFETVAAKARRGQPNEHEWTFVRKDGLTIPVLLTVTAIRDGGGLLIGFLCIASDVSERKRTMAQITNARQAAEAALYEVELQRDALDEHAYVSITDAKGQINYVNAKFCDLSGYSPLELIGQNHSIVSSTVHPPEFWRDFWQTISRGKVWHGEVCNRHKSGSLYWVDSTVVPFRNREGMIDRFVAIRTDITARKNHEAELSSARVAAESASKAKSEFLAVMSHEIRTPLNAVIGFAELLIDTPLQPQQLEYVDIIRSSSGSLISLINDILDFSKIEAGKLDIERVRIDAVQAVESIASTFAVQAKSRGLWLRASAEDGIPSIVDGDLSRLRQVLINLVSNGLKFTAQGGVTIIVGRAPDAPASTLRFSVKDTGIGIPEEKQALLFQKFTQADSSITRRFGGTGLGLAICKRLIELMGGRVGLVSSPAEGSTFWFELPLSADQAPLAGARRPGSPQLPASAPEGTAPAAAKAPTRCALVADDNRLNQRLVRTFLSKLGFDSVVANNGAEALSLVQSRPFDIVLMDHQMPVMDGCEATRAIRAWEAATGRTSRLPIIALTANASADGEAFYREAGMDAYLTKPILMPSFSRTIDALLAPKPAEGEAPPSPRPAVMDRAAALAAVGGDVDFLAELGRTFRVQSDELLTAISSSIDSRDPIALRQVAHKLRGSVGCFSAESLVRFTQTLEETGDDPDWAEVRSVFQSVTTAIGRLREELASHPAGPVGV